MFLKLHMKTFLTDIVCQKSLETKKMRKLIKNNLDRGFRFQLIQSIFTRNAVIPFYSRQ